MTLEATAGDYRFSLNILPDGTQKCTRTPVDDPLNTEDLTDWAQLPETVRKIFAQVEKEK